MACSLPESGCTRSGSEWRRCVAKGRVLSAYINRLGRARDEKHCAYSHPPRALLAKNTR